MENECLLICQRNVREFYNFQFVSNDENQEMSRTVNNVKGALGRSYSIILSSIRGGRKVVFRYIPGAGGC